MILDSILQCRTLSITGMAKNTGKTVTLNYLLELLRERGKKVAVTSIGIDGEKTDQVTQTEKPEIELYEGTVFVTSARIRTGARNDQTLDQGGKTSV